MVFSVFKNRVLNVSSEPFFAIISQFQERIPCFKNFLRARSNFRELAKKNATHLKPQYKFVTVAMPSLVKSKNRLGIKKAQGEGNVPTKMIAGKSTTEAIQGSKDKIMGRTKMFHTHSSKNAARKDLMPQM